jgi:hypothetical protein
MVVLNVYHDLDNDVHVHLIVLVALVDNNHHLNNHIFERMMDTLAFHDENMLVLAMMLVRMVNET